MFLNLGSAVMGPEVYLKSLSMARNIAAQRGEEIRHFTTANFDLIEFSDFPRGGQSDRCPLLPPSQEDNSWSAL